MEFKEEVLQLGQRVIKFRDQIKTEEATKNAFIMPFIQLLGYDVFNPLEVVPEFIADSGAKNIEKVDYAILKDGEPVIIVECKNHLENLQKHYTQLHKYFHMTKSKVAILTNGIQFEFYTDIDNQNKLDEKPFFSFDITTIKEQQIKELSKYHKSGFEMGAIISAASELKYIGMVQKLLMEELKEPSQEFVRYFASRVSDKKLTEAVMQRFTIIMKKTVEQTFSELVNERLMNAINQSKNVEKEVTTDPIEFEQNEKEKLVTTEEELNGYYIVKSIVRTSVDISRICMRDAQSYFSVLLDDNNRKPICRLYLNSATKKYIGLFDKDKKETKYEIQNIDDIYNYSQQLCDTLAYYS